MNNNPYSNPYVPFKSSRTMHPTTTIITEDTAITQAPRAAMEIMDITTILISSNPTMVRTDPYMVSTVKMPTLITINQTKMQLIVVLVLEQPAVLAVFCRLA
jgi:hypothetical protein